MARRVRWAKRSKQKAKRKGKKGRSRTLEERHRLGLTATTKKRNRDLKN